MKKLLCVYLLLALSGLLPAQQPWCGSELYRLSPKDQAAARAFTERERPPVSKGGAVDSVAVSVHIVESRGQSATVLTYAQIEAEIAKVNRIYGSSGIYFFICGSPRYIDGSPVYNFESGDALNRQAYIAETINIYFVDDVVTSGGEALCGYAQFPFTGSPQERYVMMNKLCSTDGATLIHELGHFYGLFHTHETAFGREFVDRQNCSSAGDRFCDTDADPNLSSPGLMSGCTYVGQVTDPQGKTYRPPVSNYMSYAPSACQRQFSEEQKQRIRSVHENENAYLTSSCDFYPDFALTTQQNALTIRSDERITVTYVFQQTRIEREYGLELKISLADEPDQEGLLLHKERLFLLPGKSEFNQTYTLDFPIAKGSGSYYLKAEIDADNEIIERTENNNTTTTAVTVDNTGLQNAVVFPNPAGDQLKLFIRDRRTTGSLDIRIFRYDGRLVWQKEGFKTQEEFFQLLDLSELQPGLYFVTVDFEKVNARYDFRFFKE